MKLFEEAAQQGLFHYIAMETAPNVFVFATLKSWTTWRDKQQLDGDDFENKKILMQKIADISQNKCPPVEKMMGTGEFLIDEVKFCGWVYKSHHPNTMLIIAGVESDKDFVELQMEDDLLPKIAFGMDSVMSGQYKSVTMNEAPWSEDTALS